MEGKKKVSRKQRLQQIARDSVGFVQPLPSEAHAISNLQDTELFRTDATGTEAPVVAPSKPKKKTSLKVPASKSVQKQVQRAAQSLAPSSSDDAAAAGKAVAETATEIRTAYAKAELYDFWSAGEAGLPPLTRLAKTDLNGRAPEMVVNEWNIGSFDRMSATRAQRVHQANRKIKQTRSELHQGLFRDLQGQSYNPAAGVHADALVRLSKLQDVKDRPELERRMENDRVELLRQQMLMDNESRPDVHSDDEGEGGEDGEEEDGDEQGRQRPLLVRKTKQQRRKEIKAHNLETEVAAKKHQKQLDHFVHRASTIKKNIDKQDDEAEARAIEVAGQSKKREMVSLNGKRVKYDSLLIGTKTSKQVVLPQILPPSQLPKSMRVIPGVGGALEDQFLKLRAKNVVEINESRRQASKPLRSKPRNTDKFDLNKHRVAEPRFKLPSKLRAKKV